MTLIPVIDLLDGQVVHAVAGQRSTYQPFRSSRLDFETPCDLVELLNDQFNPPFIYLADLNAIQSRGNNQECISQMSGFDTRFLIDSGFRRWQDYLDLRSRLPADLKWVPIFGTETLESPSELAEEARQNGSFDCESCFISVDIREKQVVQPSDFRGSEPVRAGKEFIEYLSRIGFRRFVILNLDAVGTGQADFGEWSTDATFQDSAMELFVGGGVRSWAEIERLQQQGFTGALIATAIHSGEIYRDRVSVTRSGKIHNDSGKIE